MKTTWQTKKLGDLSSIKTGKKDVNEGNPNGKYPFFTCAREHTFSDNYSFDTEALLIAGNGDVGHVSYYEGKFEAYQRTYVLSNFVDVLPRYLYIYLDGFLKDTVSKQKLGNTIPYIKMGMLTDFAVPLPTISEQKVIVKKLDEVFERLSMAKEAAEKNLQNAKELFESYSKDIFADKQNNWQKRKLSEVCVVERGSSPRPIQKYFTTDPDGVNWIKIGDTKDVDRYLYSTRQKITKAGAEKSREVKEGDLILSNSMSFGRPFIMKTKGYIHDGWFVLRPNSNIDSEYFYDVISSPQVQEQFTALASGSVVKNISGDLTKKAVLPVPSLSEQKTIVKKLERLSTETKKLEKIYEQKLADLEELKRSILNKAFHAEL